MFTDDKELVGVNKALQLCEMDQACWPSEINSSLAVIYSSRILIWQA